jgi:pyrroline-5-carboxylate reductase
MSNVAAAIGEAATGIVFNKNCSGKLKKEMTGLFNDVGKCVEIPETLMDAATALCGSGPAFLYLFIEAMADAALKVGFPRAAADLLAEQVIKGAAMTASDSELTPAQLRARVTTPAGTTIMGLYQLEDGGLRAAMMKAIDAATNRAAEFSKK